MLCIQTGQRSFFEIPEIEKLSEHGQCVSYPASWRLRSIPGLVNTSAIILMVFSYGFTNFENASQLCCSAGITPTTRKSGSSVMGKSKISKMDNPKLR